MLLSEFIEKKKDTISIASTIILKDTINNKKEIFKFYDLDYIKEKFKDYVYDDSHYDKYMISIDIHEKNYGVCVGDIVNITGKNFVIDKIEDEFAFIKLENNFCVSISCKNIRKYKVDSYIKNKITPQVACTITEHINVFINNEVIQLDFACINENNKYVFTNGKIELCIDKETYDKYKGCECDV